MCDEVFYIFAHSFVAKHYKGRTVYFIKVDYSIWIFKGTYLEFSLNLPLFVNFGDDQIVILVIRETS